MSKKVILKQKLVVQELIINCCTKVIWINSSVNPVTFRKRRVVINDKFCEIAYTFYLTVTSAINISQ